MLVGLTYLLFIYLPYRKVGTINVLTASVSNYQKPKPHKIAVRIKSITQYIKLILNTLVIFAVINVCNNVLPLQYVIVYAPC